VSFLLRKVEDVMTISRSQSLTSVSIKDCTLNKSGDTGSYDAGVVAAHSVVHSPVRVPR